MVDGLETFGLPDSAKGAFFGSVDSVDKASNLNGQAHYLRRAFTEMKLDGILCLDGKPTVYLKDYKRPVHRSQVNKLQKQFWNHATGTLLVVQDPEQVYILSGMIPPSEDTGPVDQHGALVEKLERVANALEKHRFVEQVASGHYYRKHVKYFDASNAVDQCLLDDLSVVGRSLCRNDSPDERKRVHALLGRIIFTCYLIDREIIFLRDYPFIRKQGVAKLLDLFEQYLPQEATQLLDRLFGQLRVDFNGSMFDEGLDAERKAMSGDDIEALERFFRGESSQGGQRTFGFWAYDFSIIPVETISAIYEKFLEDEDAAGKQATGAFYTPRHLAEMVVDEAVAASGSLLAKKYLDPACGSGVFLVILFSRLAEEWQRSNPGSKLKTKARALLDILKQKICGVDVNLTACRIACFSLYVAFLDQFDPPTLRELQKNVETILEKGEKILPKLLAYKEENYKNTATPAIFEGNFFDPALPIPADFDVVVGNPPWVGRGQPADKQIEDWVFSNHNPYLKTAPKVRAKRVAIFLPQRQIAHAFLWKAPLAIKETGRVSFLLPSEMLLNPALWNELKSNDIDAMIDELVEYKKAHFPDDRRRIFSGGGTSRSTVRVQWLPPAASGVHVKWETQLYGMVLAGFAEEAVRFLQKTRNLSTAEANMLVAKTARDLRMI